MKQKIIVTALVTSLAVSISQRAEAVVTITATGTITDSFSNTLNIGDSVTVQFIANSGITTANAGDSDALQYWEYNTAAQQPLWNNVTATSLAGLFSNSFPGDQMFSQIIRFPSEDSILTVRAASDESGFDIGLTSNDLPVWMVDLNFRGSHIALITNPYFTGQTLDETFKNGTFLLVGGFSSGEVQGIGGFQYTINSVTITGAAVPEPSSLGLALVGVFGVVARRRRK